MTDFCALNVLPIGFGFGYQELLIVALIFLILFGGAKLPSLMRNMGRSINEFKAGMQDKPDDSIGDKDRDATEAIEEETANRD